VLLGIATRFNEICRVLLAFLALNLVLVNTLIPVLAFGFFTDTFAGIPVPAIATIGTAAWVLSAPGLAAAFAAYRDSPLLRCSEPAQVREARVRRRSGNDAVAGSYWPDRDEWRIVLPYLGAYVRLVARSLQVSLIFGAILTVLLVGAILTLGAGPGPPALPAVLLAVAAITVVAHLVALVLVVELPRAQRGAIVRNAYLLTARRPVRAVLALGSVAVFAVAFQVAPLIALTIGTGLVFFFTYHASHAVATPVLDLVIAEDSEVTIDPHPPVAVPL